LAAPIVTKLGAGEQLSDADWAVIAKYATDPQFASALVPGGDLMGVAKAAGMMCALLSSDGPGGDTDALAADRKTVTARLQLLGTVVSTWASFSPREAETVAAIMAALRNDDENGAQRNIRPGMTVLLGYTHLKTSTAVNVADQVYDWETTSTTTAMTPWVSWKLPDGTPVTDVGLGMLTMLANNPEAATRFFTSGAATTVSIGKTTAVMDAHIAWAMSRPWLGAQTDIGAALFAAAVPQPQPDGSTPAPTALQAQVASQVIAWTASDYASRWGEYSQGLADYASQLRPDSATPAIIAAYMPNVLQIVAGQRVPNSDRFGLGVQDDGVGLGVSKDMLGLALQAVGTDTNNIATVIQGWVNYLPQYLTDQILPNGGTPSASDIHYFLQDPGATQKGDPTESPAADALREAARGLDFFNDNLVATWKTSEQQSILEAVLGNLFGAALDVGMDGAFDAAGKVGKTLGYVWQLGEVGFDTHQEVQAPLPDPSQQAQDATDSLTDKASEAASRLWVETLAQIGYITPTTIEANNANPSNKHIADPSTFPGGPVLVPNPAGGYMLNPGAPAAVDQWLGETQFMQHGGDAVAGTRVGDPSNSADLITGLKTDQTVGLP